MRRAQNTYIDLAVLNTGKSYPYICVNIEGNIRDQCWFYYLFGHHVALLDTGELVYYINATTEPDICRWGEYVIGKGAYHHSERI